MKFRSFLAVGALLTIFAAPIVNAQNNDQVINDLLNQARTGTPSAAPSGAAPMVEAPSDGERGFGQTKMFEMIPSEQELLEALLPTEATKDLKVIPRSQQRGAGLVITFDSDSSELRGESRRWVDRLGSVLRDPRLKRARLELQGRTDAAGDYEYNDRLSLRRAAAVAEYLHYNYGVDPANIKLIGFGKRNLTDPYNPYGRINRNVQIGVTGHVN